MKQPYVAILLTLLVGCGDSNEDDRPPVLDMGSTSPPWGPGDTGSNEDTADDRSNEGGARSDSGGSPANGGSPFVSTGGEPSSGGTMQVGGSAFVSSGGEPSSGGSATSGARTATGDTASDF